ncbi:MAG: hypothetical protein HYS06_12915 [Methylocystis sp.]|nr:hypothetical protein [Methylocystis sp.]
MQISRRFRWLVYAAVAALFATGAGWLVADQLKDTDAGEFWQAVTANLLMVHGGLAMAMLLLLGALGPLHVGRSWRAGKNRLTGAVVAASNAALVITAFGLYYFGSRDLRSWTSDLHIVVGFALPAFMFVHILVGRRNGSINERGPDDA